MIKVTLIRPDGCSHCVAVKATLESMKSDYPDLAVEEVDMATPEGQEMVQKYGILSSPGILVSPHVFKTRSSSSHRCTTTYNTHMHYIPLGWIIH